MQGLIWKDLRATFETRLAETGCDAFTIAQLLGHSDVRVTMRYVRMVEDSKRVAVEAMKLLLEKLVTYWPDGQNSHRCRRLSMIGINGGAEEGRTPGLRIANGIIRVLWTTKQHPSFAI
jgi:integrase-like protein